MAINWSEVRFFKREEFDSPDAPGSGDQMRECVILKLQQIREELRSPMTINSGFRTKAHNKAVGGSFLSEHMIGYAVDVACVDAYYRYRLLKVAFSAEVPRIEAAPTWIHLGWSPSHPQNVAFYP